MSTLAMISQLRPPKPKWTLADMPDLSDKVAIVTGGNGGVGKEIVKGLLEHKAKVYMACRSKAKAEPVIAELKAATGNEAIFLPLDLASLSSVRKAAEEFQSQESALHMLFNNGVMEPPMDQLTEEGYDLQFGTNVVGHFFFTELLIPQLTAGAELSTDKTSRVVTTSSSASYHEAIHWDALTDTPERRKMKPAALYGQSKFGNAVVAFEVNRRYANKGIVSIAVNPGNLRTDLTRNLEMNLGLRIAAKLILYPADMGAITPLWAGCAAESAKHGGKFLIPWARVGETNKQAYDTQLGARLWTWLQDQVKGK